VIAPDLERRVVGHAITISNLLRVKEAHYRSEIKGVVFAKQGGLKVVDEFKKRKDPRNSTYYWMSGDVVLDPNEKNTDGDYVSKNYVTITPVHYDFTHYETLEKLKDLKIDY
jgi:5'-nucleotidase